MQAGILGQLADCAALVEAAGKQKASTRERCVLVIEDDCTLNTAISAMLTDLGYGVEIATDNTEALDKLAELDPALVICEYRSARIEGIRLVRAIRHRIPDTLCLLLADAKSCNSIGDFTRFGVSGLVLKPVDSDQLRTQVGLCFRFGLPMYGARWKKVVGTGVFGGQAIG